jgi:hypothetical protein
MAGDVLRVLFDATALPERPAGAGVYTVELARALSARADIELYVASPRDVGAGTWLRTPGGAARLTRGADAHAETREAPEADVIRRALRRAARATAPRVATVHDLLLPPSAQVWAAGVVLPALARLGARAGG